MCSANWSRAKREVWGLWGTESNDPYRNFNQSNVGVYPDGYDPNGFIRDVGVYAKITIPIGKPKERLDCSKLYKLELRARELEIRKLEAEVANLRNLRFTDDGGN